MKGIKEGRVNFSVLDIIIYIIMGILGVLFVACNYQIFEPVDFVYIIFNIFCILYFIAFIINIKNTNYENLIFVIINFICAMYIKLELDNIYIIVPCAMGMYTILSAENKLISFKTLLDDNDVTFLVKAVSMVLILMLGLIFIPMFINDKYSFSIVLGYYVIAFVFTNILEAILYIILRKPKIEKKLNHMFKLNIKKEQKNKPKKALKVRAIRNKKITKL